MIAPIACRPKSRDDDRDGFALPLPGAILDKRPKEIGTL